MSEKISISEDKIFNNNETMKDLYVDYAGKFVNFYPDINLSEEVINSIKNRKMGIAYADLSASQTMDIYYPDEGTGPYPVIMSYHAGGFSGGTNHDFTLDPMFEVLKHGYALASIEYRRSGEARFPAAIYDAKASVRFIRANASELNIDPNKIVSWGYSSGGYLAAMLAVTSDEPLFNDEKLGNINTGSKVQAAIVGCGPCGNFLEIDPELEKSGMPLLFRSNDPYSPLSWFLGVPPLTAPEKVRLADTCIYVNESASPVLVLHGTDDPIVPFSMAEKFVATLRKKAGKDKVNFIIGRGNHHCDDPWFQSKEIFDIAFDFLQKCL